MIRSFGAGAIGLVLVTTLACGGGGDSEAAGGGSARVTIDGTSFEVRDVTLEMTPGQDGWYRVEGQPAEKGECVPGLDASVGLYGSLPASVKTPIDLIGTPLPVEFSGDGDDANLCFPGVGGLLGAQDATITVTSVSGDRAEFTMSGRFTTYDENANPSPSRAEASGTARIRTGPE